MGEDVTPWSYLAPMRGRRAVTGGVLLTLCLTACGPAGHEPGTEALVVDVVDGDTLRVSIHGIEEDVRLLGVNSPEMLECLGPESGAALARLVEGRIARLVADHTERDRYGRLLRLVFSGNRLVNEHLVREGMALAVPVPPDTSAAAVLQQAEIVAEGHGAGIWAPDACGPEPVEGLRIEQIHSGADGAVHPRDAEWVAIVNLGSAEVDLGGWTLRDGSSSHRYRFPPFVLAVGARVRVRSGCGQDTGDTLHWCASTPVWNDHGDHVLLLDPFGNIAAHRRY